MMEPYELRKHLVGIVELLREILAEVKAMRQDYAEGQACVAPVENAFEICFNTPYEG